MPPKKMKEKKKKVYLKKGEVDARKVVGAPIHVSATLLFSNQKERGRMIGTIEKDVPKYADGCVKKVIHRLTGTTHKKNNCYLVCNFDLCGKHYEKEFSLAKVRAGRANIAPSTDPHYAGAAAAAAAATTTATEFSVACEAGVGDVDATQATQTTPAPGQSPTLPATTNDDVLIDPAILVQGAEQATLALGMSSPPTGAAAAAAAAAASTTPPPGFGSLSSPLLSRPPSSLGRTPPGCISTNTKEHFIFNEATPKNNQKWYHPNGKPIVMDPVKPVKWSVTDSFGNVYYPGCAQPPLSKLNAWMLMYGDTCLNAFVDCTNIELKKRGEDPFTDLGEAIRFQGIMRLITRFEFANRRDLWVTKPNPKHKYMPAPAFGRTGMSRDRFDIIFRCQRYSKQPDVPPEGMSSYTEGYRWMLVDDHIKNFNDWRATMFKPGTYIVVDESIFRWYGHGGDWINWGLPHYVDMDRKPDSGCEIQNSCDVETGIMLRLKVVKTPEELQRTEDHTGAHGHGTQVTLDLVSPWSRTRTERVILGDSYFASLKTCRALKDVNLRFIGPVKSCHAGFPQKYFNNLRMNNRGEHYALYTIDDSDRLEIMAYTWMDKNRMQYVSTASSTYHGESFERNRLRQVDKDKHAAPVMQHLQVRQPEACEDYFVGNGMIDEHNRLRQSSFQLERKLKVRDWDLRVNHGILGMVDVDTIRFGRAMGWWPDITPHEFYLDLAHEMIDNDITSHRRTRGSVASQFASVPCQKVSRKALVPNLIDTEKRRGKRQPDGKIKKNDQRIGNDRCKVCKTKCTSKICSICRMPICGPRTLRNCWNEHCDEYHS